MATSKETIDFILSKLADNRVFQTRSMFGEYALYANKKVVALVCDDQLYVKITPESKSLEEVCDKDHPYTGSKPYYLVTEDQLSQLHDLPNLLIKVASKLPEPKASKRKPGEESFSAKVLKLALSIPPGRVTTYGALSKSAGGGAMAAQSITTILGKAYKNGSKNIPWHRIVYSDGRVWIDESHKKQRLALYKKEKIQLDKNNKIVNFKKLLYKLK